MTDLELNLAVARHVFGFEPVEVFSTSTGRHRWRVPGAPGELLRPYATTGDGMLEVIEKLAGKFQIRIDGCNVSAHESGPQRGCWGVTIAPWGTDPDDGRGSASPNLPRAVAIAALRALVPGFST